MNVSAAVSPFLAAPLSEANTCHRAHQYHDQRIKHLILPSVGSRTPTCIAVNPGGNSHSRGEVLPLEWLCAAGTGAHSARECGRAS